MTEKERTGQSVEQPMLLSIEPGDKRIKDAKERTTWFVKQFRKSYLYGNLVAAAGLKNLLLIMKTTTSLSTSCGFANLATNNGTKN